MNPFVTMFNIFQHVFIQLCSDKIAVWDSQNSRKHIIVRFLTRSSTKGSGSSDFVGFDVVSNLCKAMRRTPETLQKLSPQMCSASPFRNKPISAVDASQFVNSFTHINTACGVVYVRLFPFDFRRLESFLNGSETMCYCYKCPLQRRV